jgi:hypothetical protein
MRGSAVTRLVAAVVLAVGPASIVRAQCLGDCDGNGEVTIEEIVRAVNIALLTAEPSRCPVYSEAVTIDQLIGAVNNVLDGCPAPPADTETPAEPATPTDTPVSTDTRCRRRPDPEPPPRPAPGRRRSACR